MSFKTFTKRFQLFRERNRRDYDKEIYFIILLMIDSLKRMKSQLKEIHDDHFLKFFALNIINYILNKIFFVRFFSSVSAIKFKEQCFQIKLFENLKEHAEFHDQFI